MLPAIFFQQSSSRKGCYSPVPALEHWVFAGVKLDRASDPEFQLFMAKRGSMADPNQLVPLRTNQHNRCSQSIGSWRPHTSQDPKPKLHQLLTVSVLSVSTTLAAHEPPLRTGGNRRTVPPYCKVIPGARVDTPGEGRAVPSAVSLSPNFRLFLLYDDGSLAIDNIEIDMVLPSTLLSTV